MISSRAGRLGLFVTILAGAVLTAAILAWQSRDGAISPEVVDREAKRLVGHYAVMLAVVAGFYFSERNAAGDGTSTAVEAFVLAMVLVGTWSLGPPVLIALSATIESAMRHLDSMSVIGASLASAALAFYFSRSGKADESR